MTNQQIEVLREKLQALKRKTAIAKSSYKTGFIFAGKRMSVEQAEMEIDFLTTQIKQHEQATNKSGGPENPQSNQS